MTGEALSYSERVDRDRRRWVLRILDANGGGASESTIEQSLIDLGERVGVDRAYVRAQLKALEAADCITIQKYRDTIMVAELTATGAAVLHGRRRVDQVTAWKPGDPVGLDG